MFMYERGACLQGQASFWCEEHWVCAGCLHSDGGKQQGAAVPKVICDCERECLVYAACSSIESWSSFRTHKTSSTAYAQTSSTCTRSNCARSPVGDAPWPSALCLFTFDSAHQTLHQCCCGASSCYDAHVLAVTLHVPQLWAMHVGMPPPRHQPRTCTFSISTHCLLAGDYDTYVQTRAELEENQMKKFKWEQEQISHMKVRSWPGTPYQSMMVLGSQVVYVSIAWYQAQESEGPSPGPRSPQRSCPSCCALAQPSAVRRARSCEVC